MSEWSSEPSNVKGYTPWPLIPPEHVVLAASGLYQGIAVNVVVIEVIVGKLIISMICIYAIASKML